MRSDDISRDINGKPPSGDRDIGMRQGVILAWNDLTGENLVDVEGQVFEDLDVLMSGIGIRYSVNDVVSIIRRQSKYYIQGKVGAVNGAAGSSVQEYRGNYSDTVANTAGAWVDVPSGPATVQAYVGSSRMAIVMWRADIFAQNSFGEISWTVSGASSIAAAAWAGMSIIGQANSGAAAQSTSIKATISGFFTMNSSLGMRNGLNTFTLKYRVGLFGTGINATFGSPQLTVIPL